MSGAIQIGGLASGLDTKNIIDELMKVEKQPLDRIESQKKKLGIKKEALQEINTSLLSLYSSVSTLTLESTFLGKISSSSDESVLTASAGTEAAIGKYDVTITRLATPSSVASTNKVGDSMDPSKKLDDMDFRVTPTTGTISLTVDGAKYEVFVNTSSDSLNDVISNINTAVGSSIASYNSTNDTLVLSKSGSVIQVGAQGDTSNFWNSVYLKGVNSGSTLESQTHLGAINSSQTLSDVNFSSASPLSSGYFTINGVTISVDTSTDTLDSVLSKINSSEANVYSYYDTIQDKIVMKSKIEGPQAISLGVSGDTSNFLDVFQVKTATQNIGNTSEFTISGFNSGNPITRSTNTIDDVIPNVTFTLKNKGTSTITVSSDTDKAINAVKDFIDKYNTTIDLLNERLNEVPLKNPTTEEGEKIGILRSDSTLSLTLESIRKMVTDKVSSLPENMNMLWQVGISTGDWDSSSIGIESAKKGHLKLDESKLKSALSSDPGSVSNLFDTGTDGVARKVKDYLGSITDFNGIIKDREDAIDSQVKNLNGEISDWQERLKKIESDYWKKFTAMEQMISQMQSMSSWLSKQFSSMSGSA